MFSVTLSVIVTLETVITIVVLFLDYSLNLQVSRSSGSSSIVPIKLKSIKTYCFCANETNRRIAGKSSSIIGFIKTSKIHTSFVVLLISAIR